MLLLLLFYFVYLPCLIIRANFCLILVVCLSQASLAVPMQGTSQNINLFYILGAPLAAYSLFYYFFFVTKVSKNSRQPYRKYVYLFIFIILITIFSRGIGLTSLGGETWGGFVYIKLLIVLALILFSGFIHLTEKQWRYALIGMCLIPLLTTVPDWGLLVRGEVPVNIKQSVSSAMGAFMSPAQISRYAEGQVVGFYLIVLAMMLFFTTKKPIIEIFLVLFGFIFIGISGHRISIMKAFFFFLIIFVFSEKKKYVNTLIIVLIFLFTIGLFANQLVFFLPLSFQRALSFIPGLSISPEAFERAAESLDWRINMWKVAAEEIPRYLFMGKGYSISSSELYALSAYDPLAISVFMLTSNFHNGPLDLLIGFGLFGLLAVLALFVSVYVRHFRWSKRNWNSGVLRSYHKIILAIFIVEAIIFLFVFGAASSLPVQLFLIVILEGLVVSDLHIGKISEVKSMRTSNG